MGDQLCVKKILNNHWISGVLILKGLIRLLKRLKFCLVNTETTVKLSGALLGAYILVYWIGKIVPTWPRQKILHKAGNGRSSGRQMQTKIILGDLIWSEIRVGVA